MALCGAEAWNAWRKLFPSRTIGTLILNSAKFNDACELKNFNGFDFGDFTSFEGAKFQNEINFSGCNFGLNSTFNKATFPKVSFYDCKFYGETNFEDVKFNSDAKFYKCNFMGSVSFEKAYFKMLVSFYTSKFSASGYQNFYNARFDSLIDFSLCEFGYFNFSCDIEQNKKVHDVFF